MVNLSLRLMTVIACGSLLVGCADVPKVMSFSAGSADLAKVWPLLPDEPKYRYIGELTGEANFHASEDAQKSTSAKLLDWLTGLSSAVHTPTVLQRPQSGVVDEAGRVYVTDVSKGVVYVFDKIGGKLDVWEMARANVHFKTPIGITLANQDILVADAELHAVFRLDGKGNPVGEIGQDILKRPTGLAYDVKRGVIYVSDTYSHDIKVFDDAGKLLKTIGQRGEDAGEFNFPTYLAFSGDHLYVTDTLNSRIQIFDADGKLTGKFGSRGLYIGNLVRPKGVAVDSVGNIYVVESLHDRLLVFNDQGQVLLAIGDSGKETGQFYLPAGVWVDHQDRVYVADMFNGRVMVLQFLGGTQ